MQKTLKNNKLKGVMPISNKHFRGKELEQWLRQHFEEARDSLYSYLIEVGKTTGLSEKQIREIAHVGVLDALFALKRAAEKNKEENPVMEMAQKSRKTEHSGAKKGKGAYWGKKYDAKKDSKKKRRQEDKRVVSEAGSFNNGILNFFPPAVVEALKDWAINDGPEPPRRILMKLMDYYRDEMPYDVQKARTLEPEIWLQHKLEREFQVNEVSPPFWHGTVRAMYTHHPEKFQEPGEKKKPGELNPWATAWSMKKKDYNPHYKDQPTSLKGTPHKKEKYKKEDLSLEATLREIFNEDHDDGERFYMPEPAYYDNEPDYDDQRAIARSEIHGEWLDDMMWQVTQEVIKVFSGPTMPSDEQIKEQVDDEISLGDYPEDFVVEIEESPDDKEMIYAMVKKELEREHKTRLEQQEAKELDTDKVLNDALEISEDEQDVKEAWERMIPSEEELDKEFAKGTILNLRSVLGGPDLFAFEYAMEMAGIDGLAKNGKELREILMALALAPPVNKLSYNTYQALESILDPFYKKYPKLDISEAAKDLASYLLKDLGVRWN